MEVLTLRSWFYNKQYGYINFDGREGGCWQYRPGDAAHNFKLINRARSDCAYDLSMPSRFLQSRIYYTLNLDDELIQWDSWGTKFGGIRKWKYPI
jgi:hypothetical protein